jgi:hypothetical protein
MIPLKLDGVTLLAAASWRLALLPLWLLSHPNPKPKPNPNPNPNPSPNLNPPPTPNQVAPHPTGDHTELRHLLQVRRARGRVRARARIRVRVRVGS